MLNRIKGVMGDLLQKKIPRTCLTCQNWNKDFENSSYGICNIKYDRFTKLKIPLRDSITVHDHECDEEGKYMSIDK